MSNKLKNERSVSTGQIRAARGLASEDLIGLTLAQLSLEGGKKNLCQQETEGNLFFFSFVILLLREKMDDIIVIIIISVVGGGLGGFKRHLQRGHDLFFFATQLA